MHVRYANKHSTLKVTEHVLQKISTRMPQMKSIYFRKETVYAWNVVYDFTK